jgi:hypothetical protein
MATQIPTRPPPNQDVGLDFQPLSTAPACNSSVSDKKNVVLKGCASNVTCEAKGVEKGNTLAPWVLVEFLSGDRAGNKITVSNRSSPGTDPPHTTVIQSFELGFKDGLQSRMTIHDTEGGSFVQFAENLLTDWQCVKDPGVPISKVKMQFGWVKSGCPIEYTPAFSRCYYGIIQGLDTSYTEGKFIAEVTISDVGTVMMEGNVEEIKGSDDQTMCLADAITLLLTQDVAPNVAKVSFRKLEGKQLVPTGFLKNDPDCDVKNVPTGGDGKPSIIGGKGPKDKWDPKSQDKMTAAMRWIGRFNSIDKKGWVPFFNPDTIGGEIIFLADGKPECDDETTAFFWDKCLGHYVVNGGNDSPVLEFNPKIKWDFAQLQAGGGVMGDQSTNPIDEEGAKSPGRRSCQTLRRARIPGAGHPMHITSDEVNLRLYGKKAEKESQDNQTQQIKAARVNADPIQAELVIVGYPEYVPLTSHGKYVSITVINPFFVTAKRGQGCGDWDITTKNACNEVLSNPGWLIDQVNHKIELGKFTTHITVELASPGSPDGNVGQHGGLWTGLANWSNGWVPVTC